MKGKTKCNTSINNVINIMKLSRHNMICSEEFSDLYLRETELFDIDFSKDGLFPTSFTNCDISLDSLMLRGHRCPPWCVAISGDGRYFATGTSEKEGLVYIWDLQTRKVYKRIKIELINLPIPIDCVSFSEDDKSLFVGTGLFNIYEYDIDSGQLLSALELARIKNGDYNRLSITKSISDNEKTRNKCRNEINDSYTYAYELFIFDKEKKQLIKIMESKLSYVFARLLRIREWNEGDFDYYYSTRITSINNKNGKLNIKYECAKHRWRKNTLEHYIVGVFDLLTIVDIEKNRVQTKYTAIKDVLMKYTEYRVPPDNYYSSNYEIQRLDDYKYCITNNNDNTIKNIKVGNDEDVYLDKVDNFLITHIFENASIIWNTHKMSVSEHIPVQFPSALPVRRHFRRRFDKAFWVDNDHVCIDERTFNISVLCNQIDDKEQRYMFIKMIDDFKSFKGINYLLPIGWIEYKKILYIHHDKNLFIIDALNNEVIAITQITRRIDLETDCKWPPKHGLNRNRIERVILSNERSHLVIIYEKGPLDYEIEAEVIIINENDVLHHPMNIYKRHTNGCFISEKILAIGTLDCDRTIILYNVDTGKEIKRLYHLTNVRIKGCRFEGTICDDETLEIIRQQGGKIIG